MEFHDHPEEIAVLSVDLGLCGSWSLFHEKTLRNYGFICACELQSKFVDPLIESAANAEVVSSKMASRRSTVLIIEKTAPRLKAVPYING